MAYALLACLVMQPAPAIAASDSGVSGADGARAMQVLSPSIKVYLEPSEKSTVLAEITRGVVVWSDKQSGDWYRIVRGAGAVPGWIHMEPGQYGDMSIVLLRKVPGRPAQILEPAPEQSENVVRGKPIDDQIDAPIPIIDPTQVVPPAASLPRETLPIQDRWRVMQSLGYQNSLLDPYHQNPLKGDLPLFQDSLGPGWFFNLGAVSDSLLELRELPTAVAGQAATRTGENDVFGSTRQSTFNQNAIFSFDLYKGDTTFMPPEYEFKFVPVFNFNRSQAQEVGVLNADPQQGTIRNDHFMGVQELFAELHLRDVSERYDFDSVRVGIQPFTSDFRGFLYQDEALGVRLFGNRDNNLWQYSVGALQRLEKDTNSGLNAIGQAPRRDYVAFAELFRQDFPVPGFTSEGSVFYNRNLESGSDYYNTDGELIRPAAIGDERPHNYDVTYLGYSGDGHFDTFSLTTSTYLALGHASSDPIARVPQRIQAWFHASELSHDFDWWRLRANFLYASGDSNPYDGKSTGFDAILENPQFAGADTSYYIRQGLPLIGGGGVAISGQNGILPSLRSSKDQGQSNFVNPGLTLLGVGADFDVLPTLRVITNASVLRFNDTEILGVLRAMPPPSRQLGTDVSGAVQYRPHYSQNLVFNGSVGLLFPGQGMQQLYDVNSHSPLYSVLVNAILTF